MTGTILYINYKDVRLSAKKVNIYATSNFLSMCFQFASQLNIDLISNAIISSKCLLLSNISAQGGRGHLVVYYISP